MGCTKLKSARERTRNQFHSCKPKAAMAAANHGLTRTVASDAGPSLDGPAACFQVNWMQVSSMIASARPPITLTGGRKEAGGIGGAIRRSGAAGEREFQCFLKERDTQINLLLRDVEGGCESEDVLVITPDIENQAALLAAGGELPG